MKVQEMQSGFKDQSRNPALAEFLANRTPKNYEVARSILLQEMAERKIEFLSVVDTAAHVVIGGFGNRTGHKFDPDGLSSEVIGHPELQERLQVVFKANGKTKKTDVLVTTLHHPNQLARTTVMPYSLFLSEAAPVHRERISDFAPITADHVVDTEVDGLIRYVITPIFGNITVSPPTVTHYVNGSGGANGSGVPVFGGGGERSVVAPTGDASDYIHEDLLGVLVAGDLVNGKVPIVEQSIDSFGSGYSAVWYHDRRGEARQATSYYGLRHGNATTMLAGLQLHDSQFIEQGFQLPASGEGTAYRRLPVLGDMYTVAARRLNGSDVLLLRGTSETSVRSTEAAMVAINILLVLLCVAIDCVVFYFTLKSFTRPLEKLRDDLNAHRATQTLTLDSIPSQRSFYSRSLASNLAVVMVVASLIAVQSGALRNLLAAVSGVQLNVASFLYSNKLQEMRMVQLGQSHRRVVKQAVADWDAFTASQLLLSSYSGSGVGVGVGNSSSISNSSSINNSSNSSNSTSSSSSGGGVSALSPPSSSSNLSTAAVGKVREMLRSACAAAQIELAFLVDRHRRVIVSAGGERPDFQRDTFLDPSGVVADVLKTPKTVLQSALMEHDEFTAMGAATWAQSVTQPTTGAHVLSSLVPEGTSDPVLIRWAAVPVYTPASSAQAHRMCSAEAAADGVLLYGEVVNGKLGLLKRMMDVMGDGYVAIFLFDAVTDDVTLATSLLKDHGVYESDVELPPEGVAMLRAAVASGGELVSHPALLLEGRHTAASSYSMAARAVPPKLVSDAFGTREIHADVTALVVRGAHVEARGTVKQRQEALTTGMLVGLACVLLLRALLAYTSYKPAREMLRVMVRYGFIRADRGSSSSGKSSSGSGNTTSTSSGSSDTDRPHTRVYLARRTLRHKIRHFGRRTFWNLLCLLAMALLSGVPLLVWHTSTGLHHDSTTPATMAPLTRLAEEGDELIHALQKERSLTFSLISSGWLPAEERYAADSANLTLARKRTGATRAAFLKTLSSLHQLSPQMDDAGRLAKHRLAALRAFRTRVDAHAYATASEASAVLSQLNDNLLALLFHSLRVPSHAATVRPLFSYLNFALLQELQSRKQALLARQLHAGDSFSSAEAYHHYILLFSRYSTLLRTVFSHTADHTTATAVATASGGTAGKLTKAWEEAAAGHPDSFAAAGLPSEAHLAGNESVVSQQYQDATATLRHSLHSALDHTVEEEEAAQQSLTSVAAAMLSLCACVALSALSIRRMKRKAILPPPTKRFSISSQTVLPGARTKTWRRRLRQLRRWARYYYHINCRLVVATLLAALLALAVVECVTAVTLYSGDSASLAALDRVMLFATHVEEMLAEVHTEFGLAATALGVEAAATAAAATGAAAVGAAAAAGSSSGSGFNATVMSAQLVAQHPATDRQLALVRAEAAALLQQQPSLPPQLHWFKAAEMWALLHTMEQLPVHRDSAEKAAGLGTYANIGSSSGAGGVSTNISAVDAAADELLSVYSELGQRSNELLLGVTQLALDGRSFRDTVAFVAMVFMKDIAVRERSYLTYGISRGSITWAQTRALSSMQGSSIIFNTLYQSAVEEEEQAGAANAHGLHRALSPEEVAAAQVKHWLDAAIEHPATLHPPLMPSVAEWYGNVSLVVEGYKHSEEKLQQLLVAHSAAAASAILADLLWVLVPSAGLLGFAALSLSFYLRQFAARTARKAQGKNASGLPKGMPQFALPPPPQNNATPTNGGTSDSLRGAQQQQQLLAGIATTPLAANDVALPLPLPRDTEPAAAPPAAAAPVALPLHQGQGQGQRQASSQQGLTSQGEGATSDGRTATTADEWGWMRQGPRRRGPSITRPRAKVFITPNPNANPDFFAGSPQRGELGGFGDDSGGGGAGTTAPLRPHTIAEEKASSRNTAEAPWVSPQTAAAAVATSHAAPTAAPPPPSSAMPPAPAGLRLTISAPLSDEGGAAEPLLEDAAAAALLSSHDGESDSAAAAAAAHPLLQALAATAGGGGGSDGGGGSSDGRVAEQEDEGECEEDADALLAMATRMLSASPPGTPP